jgi:hypothetical protein
MNRQKKGTVVVQEYNDGWLRLRWSYQGKRHVLALGLPADPTNQAIAERKATRFGLNLMAYGSNTFAAVISALKQHENLINRTRLSSSLRFNVHKLNVCSTINRANSSNTYKTESNNTE